MQASKLAGLLQFNILAAQLRDSARLRRDWQKSDMNRKFQGWVSKFQATGRIEPLELGCTRSLVTDTLGDPDDFSTMLNPDGHPVILKYGSLEFHFCWEGNTLSLIYSETEDGITEVSIPKKK